MNNNKPKASQKILTALAAQVAYWEGQLAMHKRLVQEGEMPSDSMLAEMMRFATQQVEDLRAEMKGFVTDRFDCAGGCGRWVNGDAGATLCDDCAAPNRMSTRPEAVRWIEERLGPDGSPELAERFMRALEAAGHRWNAIPVLPEAEWLAILDVALAAGTN